MAPRKQVFRFSFELDGIVEARRVAQELADNSGKPVVVRDENDEELFRMLPSAGRPAITH